MQRQSYTLPVALLQAIVNNLSAQPAGAVRGLLNAIEAESTRQDSERAAAEAAALREQHRNELKAELQAKLDQSQQVQTSA